MYGFDRITKNLPYRFELDNNTYIAQKVLGSGAEGVVIEGREENSIDNKRLAIKFSNNMKNDEYQFIKKVLIDKEQPNLITYYAIQAKAQGSPQNPYDIVVMEFAEGNLLELVIQKQINVTLEELIDISLQIAKGLHSLHTEKFIHRDLKPENILKVGNNWKICDFGLSKNKFAADQTLNIGTPYYIAPEMLMNQGEEQYDQKVDVWALGCIIYEIHTKNLFFQGKNQGDVSQKIAMYIQDNFSANHEHINDKRFNSLPQQIIPLVKKMLTVVPLIRIEIRDAIEELQKIQQELQNAKLLNTEKVQPPIELKQPFQTFQNVQPPPSNQQIPQHQPIQGNQPQFQSIPHFQPTPNLKNIEPNVKQIPFFPQQAQQLPQTGAVKLVNVGFLNNNPINKTPQNPFPSAFQQPQFNQQQNAQQQFKPNFQPVQNPQSKFVTQQNNPTTQPVFQTKRLQVEFLQQQAPVDIQKPNQFPPNILSPNPIQPNQQEEPNKEPINVLQTAPQPSVSSSDSYIAKNVKKEYQIEFKQKITEEAKNDMSLPIQLTEYIWSQIKNNFSKVSEIELEKEQEKELINQQCQDLITS